ncbi:MAG: hypothetical protein LBL05_06105 [Synergistaceae bacterium]|jgi:hypothetical protein|nr:hypothetical protein [Synergistaceae bacterium]
MIAFYMLFGAIAVFGVLLYFMLITRRTVLRVFGWTAFFFAVVFIIIARPSSSNTGAESTKIINDLRNLRSAVLLFYGDLKTLPLPGQEASLDAYLDRPIVLANPPRHAKVMLVDKSDDADGPPELYIGVELIPQKNGGAGIQKKLAARADDAKLLQQPASGEIYQSGLIAYMQVF